MLRVFCINVKPKKVKFYEGENMANLIVIRGGGDLATGVAWRLIRGGYRVVVLEQSEPTVIRRTVSFAEAVFSGEIKVEGILAQRVQFEEVDQVLRRGIVPVLIDPAGSYIPELHPFALVDAIIAKKNLGTHRGLAPVTIALGPGFTAGIDVDAVVETKRGHFLGRVIRQGKAAPNTGIPGDIQGFRSERLILTPCSGIFEEVRQIGDIVEQGETVAVVKNNPVCASISGVLRGILHTGVKVSAGMKAGDVDPRGVRDYAYTISDKALAVAGGVFEALLNLGVHP